MVESTSLEVFKMQLDGVVDNLVWALFPMEGWTRWPFKVLSTLVCSTVLWYGLCWCILRSRLCVAMVLAQLPTREVTPAARFSGEQVGVPRRWCL